MMGSAYRMGVDSSPRTPHDNSPEGAALLVGLGQAAARWEAHHLGANGGPKGEGEGTRAGRWGCRGLRTGEAKRGWQTGTASYEHEGAENMSCMTARVPRVWEAMQDGDNAGCGLLRVPPGCERGL